MLFPFSFVHIIRSLTKDCFTVLSAAGGIKVDHPNMSNGISLPTLCYLYLPLKFQCFSLGFDSNGVFHIPASELINFGLKLNDVSCNRYSCGCGCRHLDWCV